QQRLLCLCRARRQPPPDAGAQAAPRHRRRPPPLCPGRRTPPAAPCRGRAPMTVVVAHRPAAARRWTILRWLLPATILLAVAGYFGPWVGHRVAGLVVMGLDLGEYVKFLTPVRAGQIALWREGFYLPLVVASLAASLF